MVCRDETVGAWFKNGTKQPDPGLVVHAFLTFGIIVEPFENRRGGSGQSKRQGTHRLGKKGKRGAGGRKCGELEVVLVVVGLLLRWLR